VSCIAPGKYEHTGELYVPYAGRNMVDTRRKVLRAQRTGEYGDHDEWQKHLQGASRPFVLQDQQSARLEVRQCNRMHVSKYTLRNEFMI